MKQAKRTIAAKLSEKTGLSRRRARQVVQAVLEGIKRALGDGKSVDLGKLGKLVVVTRKPKRVIQKNLKHVGPGVFDVHKKQPKTVKLVGRGRDLSPHPAPTIVHPKEPEPKVPPRSRRVAVAIPSRWRQHPRFRFK